ncbi:PD-(D/E)XK nuclease family protein [Bifidobacterium callitrichidarum]|nr:PD-(D/E)XK nuclease family protein [Bifidobacterium callitrichidarum]
MTDGLHASDLLDGLDRDGAARLVIGAPCSGKTEFALAVLEDGLRRYGTAGAVMAVSGRVAADALGNRVVRDLGASGQARPVTTLGAVAFRAISAARRGEGLVAPRLLNGAEQDALLRQVMAVHVGHAVSGDDCATCALLRGYFAQNDWAGLVHETAVEVSAQEGSAGSGDSGAGSTSANTFAQGISDAFIGQLRDMLARLDELGIGAAEEPRLLGAAAADARLSVQWSLAFALRREYIAAQGEAYPGQYRLDASYLLVAGARAVHDMVAAHAGEGKAPSGDEPESGASAAVRGQADSWLRSLDVPELLVVDDVQDTTLAGIRFLEELGRAGVKLVLVGNPDEAVQTFRGSYPEYLMRRIVNGPLHAVEMALTHASGAGLLPTIRDISEWTSAIAEKDGLPESGGEAADPGASDIPEAWRSGARAAVVASRVSLSIPSPEEEPLPLAKRPGKLTCALRTGLADSSGDTKSAADGGGADAVPTDSTLSAELYRSPREELDDVVWRIKRAHLDRQVRWNDMAVIAHDNAAVRLYGERLRRDGVPVRYSSVTRPLKDESFVQGLFALTELALLRHEGIADCRMSLGEIASYVRARVTAVVNSPLLTVGTKPGTGGPARLAPIESALEALESLSMLAGEDTILSGLAAAWQTLRETYRETHCGDRAYCETSRETQTGSVTVDDSVIDGPSGNDLAFGADALFVMLAFDAPRAPSDAVVEAVGAVLGKDPQARAFDRLWTLVDAVNHGLLRLPPDQRRRPSYVLSLAWNAAGVAPVWQRAALENTDDGRAANDRLDAAMRLFQFAEDSTADRDIAGFMAQVRGMEVQADSLAHIGPVEDALTLTTPAGAAGRHWRYVWLPVIQQDVWPNLAGRNTLFGGEDLADLVLHDGTRQPAEPGHDPRLAAVLSSEKKSFLVALTRASRNVTVSAVWNDDATPSDFLFGYLPEHYPRNRAQARFTAVGGETSETRHEFAGLDADARGLVTAARVMLTTAEPESPEARDAMKTLALLAEHGIASADPDDWAFMPPHDDVTSSGGEGSETGAGGVSTVNATATANDVAKNDGVTAGDAVADDGDGHCPMVTLSPSAVDNLWACPVCWMLENRFAGPRPGSVATGFGTLIHAVAQQGSEEGLDRLDEHPELMETLGLDGSPTPSQRIAAVAARLDKIYQEKRSDPESIADTRDRYAAMRKDDSAADMLANIADYFVAGNGSPASYLGRNAEAVRLGRLDHVDCEREFAARFDLNDILAAYNAMEDIRPIDRATLSACMGALVGGWPQGMSEDLTVRLSGRIDRMETRIQEDGSTSIRLIDYKTGKVPTTKQIFNDLQLVCYQLGLTFPEGRARGAKALAAMPYIAQSELFHVAQNAAPAQSYAPEGVFQPPLFRSGALNEEPFTPRFHYKSPDTFYDVPWPDAATPPEDVSREDWERFTNLAGTQAMWALTMIARVFYAAAASRSEAIAAHPQPTHVAFCRMKHICPACAGQVDTVFETRQA